MAAINFTGMASGLDTRAIIDAILEVERRPIERLQERQALYNERRAKLDELRSKLNTFESALRDLTLGRSFRGRAASISDESMVRASTAAGSETGVFTIEVFNLAAAHKVKSEGFIAPDQGLIADGTITIQSGSDDPIEIEVSAAAGNNSLQAVRDTINATDAGVQASIIFDGIEHRLIVRAEESGTANALTIADSTDLGLDEVANEVTTAEDASILVDGIAVTSSSNRITGVLSGVTLDLLAETEGAPITVAIAEDTDAAVEAVQNLVEQFNGLIEFFNSQDDRDNPGPLASDPTARSIHSRIQSLFASGVSGLPVGGIRSLSAVGVSFDGKTGEATLDAAALRELFDARSAEVGNLFLSSGRATDPRVSFIGAATGTLDGEYAVAVTQAAEQATLVGSGAITTLDADETLTITVGGESVSVDLTAGMQIDEIVDTINATLSGAGVAATARDDAGVLRITSRDFGAATQLDVASDRNDPGNGTGTGFDATAATDAGVDVAGSIAGVAATGSGQLLSADAEGDFNGLVLRVTATAAEVTAQGGTFGTLSYSRGLVDTLVREIDRYTRLDSGTLDLAQDVLDDGAERLDDDIARAELRLSYREAQLLKAFSAAERAISALQAQQASLGSITSF